MTVRSLLGVEFLVLPQAAYAASNQISAPLVIATEGKRALNVACWLETSLKRVFPSSPAGTTNLSLLAARAKILRAGN
jgi:hypothetical protein